MTAIEQILKLARLYADAERVPLSTVSSRAFNDCKRLRALSEGRTITTSRADKVMLWFSDNWPTQILWPHDITRPLDSTRVAA